MDNEVFKKLLKESIQSNGDNIANQFNEVEHSEEDEDAEVIQYKNKKTKASKKVDWKLYAAQTLNDVKKWYDTLNSMPVKNEQDVEKILSKLLFSNKKNINKNPKSILNRNLKGKKRKQTDDEKNYRKLRAADSPVTSVAPGVGVSESIFDIDSSSASSLAGQKSRENKLKFYETIKKIFKSKGIELAKPGEQGLGLPRFEAFLEVLADWPKNKIDSPQEMQEFILKYVPERMMGDLMQKWPDDLSSDAIKSASSLRKDIRAQKAALSRQRVAKFNKDPKNQLARASQQAALNTAMKKFKAKQAKKAAAERAARAGMPVPDENVPNSFMRESHINEENGGYSEEYLNFLLDGTPRKEMVKALISYIQDLVLRNISAEMGVLGGEEELKSFSKSDAAKLVSKLDNAKKEIENASKNMTPENVMTLMKFYALGKRIENPDTLKKLYQRFGRFSMDTLSAFFKEEENDINSFFKGIVLDIKDTDLWSSPSESWISKALQTKNYKMLFNLDNYLEKKPNGIDSSQSLKFLEKAISDFEDSEQKMNEGFQKEDVNKYLESFIPFAKKRLGYDKDPIIKFSSDPENGKLTLGKTAYYEPAKMTVTVFTDNRHPKDIMRSLSHELVHHAQNCDGQFDLNHGMGEGYAQNDEHLRKMEEDAYLRGNMCFRDWEDNFKQNNPILERREKIYYELMRRLK